MAPDRVPPCTNGTLGKYEVSDPLIFVKTTQPYPVLQIAGDLGARSLILGFGNGDAGGVFPMRMLNPASISPHPLTVVWYSFEAINLLLNTMPVQRRLLAKFL